MAELVGVRSLIEIYFKRLSLKQDALLFNRIAIPGIGEGFNHLRTSWYSDLILDLEWLMDKIAKGLFSLKHKRIALMEAELTAPGNEIAYVIKARQKFS